MNIKKSLLQGFIWRWLFFLSLFLLNVGFSRYFGASESGKVYFITNTLNFYLLISTVNIELGIAFYAANKRKSVFTLLVTGFCLCVASAFVLILLQNISPVSRYFSSPEWPWYFPLIFVAGNCLSNFISPLFYARGNYGLPNGIMAFFMLLLTALFFTVEKTHFIGGNTMMALYFMLPLFQALFLFIVFLVYEWDILKDSKFNMAYVKRVFRYSFIAFGNSLLLFLLLRIDYWFAEHYCSPAELGNYIQASKFGQLLLIAPTVFSSVLLPRVADGTFKNYGRVLSFPFVFLTAVFLLCFLLLLVCGSSVFEVLMGHDYNSMYWPSLIKIPAILFLSLQNVLGIWFAGKNKMKYNFYSSLAGVIAMIIADLVLIPAKGIGGAAFASMLAYMVAFITSIYFYNRQSKQPFGQILHHSYSLIFNWKEETVILWNQFRSPSIVSKSAEKKLSD
ncbi:lipopolysaccharide biosynthesis protein [Pinibacter aurantiacus]|uniref:Lipopolysaccharide biosynthesis protein n=1 Tax=Pinibacter aurantiacus TaxID=2851599 RepID=A0A9E2S606_9BACT|nr:lipopolysaccharide biosynthesis protein [Pinibacter aurantiacus]MBV4355567.1 lipopolysaccharide biosynthesis protein [Pinibacter aurantiacus]